MGISLFKVGVWYMPTLGWSQKIAVDPFINPFADPLAHYVLWSWLGPFLCWLLGLSNRGAFFLFHLFFQIAFIFLMAALISKSLKEDRKKSAIMFVILPAYAISFYWVGPDSLTLFLMASIFVIPTSMLWGALIGVLLGMQHFEQSLVAFGGLLMGISISRLRKMNFGPNTSCAASCLIGVIFGKLVLIYIFKIYGIEVNSGRLFVFTETWELTIRDFYYSFQYILFSVLGLGWLFVIKYVEQGKISCPFLFSLLLLILVLPLVFDETRVGAIVTFPLVVSYLLLNASFIRSLDKKFVNFVFLAWLILPWGWVWAGRPKVSVLPWDLVIILNWFFGWFEVPLHPSGWPFWR